MVLKDLKCTYNTLMTTPGPVLLKERRYPDPDYLLENRTVHIHLIVQYYNDSNPGRAKENEECFLQNLSNKFVSRSHLLVEPNTTVPSPSVWNKNADKLVVQRISNRLTFKLALDYAETVVNVGEYVAIANTDIILDKHSKWNNLDTYFDSSPGKVMMALTRHEMSIEGYQWIDPGIETGVSQDLWIFKKVAQNIPLVPNNVLKRLNFCVGACPGCDNYVSYLMKTFGGFDVYNPAFEFKNFHLDRCRGHTLGQMIFTDKTDFTVRDLMLNDPNILHQGSLCIYTNYKDFVNLDPRIQKPLNVVSCECYNKPGMTYPHAHFSMTTEPQISSVVDLFAKNITDRIIGVCSSFSVTQTERFQILYHSVNIMIRYQQFVNVLEILQGKDLYGLDNDISNFPDGAALFTNWAVCLAKQNQTQSAINKAAVALKFNLTNECNLKNYYNNNGTVGESQRVFNEFTGAGTVTEPSETETETSGTETDCYICIPLFNRATDVTNLLINLNEIYDLVLEKCRLKLRVIIGDFNSTDISFAKVFSDIQDINTANGKNSYSASVLQCGGSNFNIAKSLQMCAEHVISLTSNASDAILMFVDADTVFEIDSITQIFNSVSSIKKTKSYYCPIVSTQTKPTQWPATFDGSVYVPDVDHLGTGLVAIYASDYAKSGGFQTSEFLGERGEHWGQHDTFLDLLFKQHGMQPIRPVESAVWLRKNNRDPTTKWFSKSGAGHF